MERVNFNYLPPVPTVKDLAPGMDYVIEVRAVKDHLIGRESPVKVTTKGQKLKPVENFQAVLMKDVGTTVKLSWSPPQDKAQKVCYL